METLLRKSIVEGTPYIANRFYIIPKENLHLKVFISSNQLQFLICDDQDTIFYLHPFELNDDHSTFLNPEITREIFEALTDLNQKFGSFSMNIFIPDFTLVPSSMDQQAVEDFLLFVSFRDIPSRAREELNQGPYQLRPPNRIDCAALNLRSQRFQKLLRRGQGNDSWIG